MSSHLPTPSLIASWPDFTPKRPLSILVSGCLAEMPVGYDGSTYGEHPHIKSLMALPNVKATVFCPENFSFGTPRALCDIHGGDGYDVLAGKARVLTVDGQDWTDGMIAAAREMLRIAQENDVRLAVLMDISGACGSQVIYGGTRPNAPYIASQGVCAALLLQNDITVVSQRDFKTLHHIWRKLDPSIPDRDDLLDHHEIEWYRDYFGATH